MKCEDVVIFLCYNYLSMKIAFVSTFFTSSLLPLMKHLTERGHQTDLFLFSKYRSMNDGCLLFDEAVLRKKIKKIRKDNSIYSFLNTHSNISVVPFHIVKNRRYVIGFIPYFVNYFICKKLTELLRIGDYDYVYLNVNEEHDAMLCKMLKRNGFKHVIIAYHEVLVSHMGKSVLKKVVKETLSLGFQLVTYSQHTKKQLQELSGITNICVIPFGLFETYTLFNLDTPMITGQYVLCIGSISPYKGLSFFYNTINDVIKNPNFKIVIAGAGYDAILEKIRKDERFILINRFLSEGEFSNLISFAKCIVCPYVSGSQSGIPVTAMALGTPIVATNVGAFPEFIENGRNGYLVNYGDTIKLSEAIFNIIEGNFVKNYIPSNLEWPNICVDFEKMLANS